MRTRQRRKAGVRGRGRQVPVIKIENFVVKEKTKMSLSLLHGEDDGQGGGGGGLR